MRQGRYRDILFLYYITRLEILVEENELVEVATRYYGDSSNFQILSKCVIPRDGHYVASISLPLYAQPYMNRLKNSTAYFSAL